MIVDLIGALSQRRSSDWASGTLLSSTQGKIEKMRAVETDDRIPSTDYIVEADDLTKQFAGFYAVESVNLRIRRNTVHALIGPNGAGKTTCFNLLTKFLKPSSGTIRFNGRDITQTSPVDVAQLGMVRSFQISATFPHMTLLENVRIALQRKLGTTFHFWRSENSLSVLDDQAKALLDDVGLGELASKEAIELSYGRKRALEIATTLALDPEMLLLDEPTSGMGREDIAHTADLIQRIAANRTVLMVEHNLPVVAGLCNTITVLARGKILTEGTYAEVSNDPRVMEAYMGTEKK